MSFTPEQITYLNQTFERYDINTHLRKINFMANANHESQGFTR